MVVRFSQLLRRVLQWLPAKTCVNSSLKSGRTSPAHLLRLSRCPAIRIRCMALILLRNAQWFSWLQCCAAWLVLRFHRNQSFADVGVLSFYCPQGYFELAVPRIGECAHCRFESLKNGLLLGSFAKRPASLFMCLAIQQSRPVARSCILEEISW